MDPDVHRSLLERRFPDLVIASMASFGAGWDTVTYLINGDLVAQFPASDGAPANDLRRLLAMLPEIGKEVSAPIPCPVFGSEEAPPCIVYPLIEGAPIDRAPGGIWPERLGRFLHDLHLMPPEYVGMRSRDVEDVRAERRADIAAKRAMIDPILGPEERMRTDGFVAAFLDDDVNWRFAPCVHHGDIGPPHVLVSQAGDLAGVIDWGDAEVGDPAGDFAWMLHGTPDAGERALAAYGGEPDARFRQRALAIYRLMPWSDIRRGVRTSDDGLVEEGLAAYRERLG